MRRPLALAVLLLGAPARALEWTPVLNGSLSGGQYFFQKQRGSLSGNASLTAAGLVKLSPRWSVLPMYAVDYRGTKGLDDGVGAGTLFQQTMDHSISATGIRRVEDSAWRLKPSAGYKRQFLKQTRDEAWGKGLFDYEKISVGFEAENVYKEPFSWRAGVDVYRVRFPQYESLESRTGTDPFGNPLGRELAPKNVLDTWNYQLSASGSRPWPYADPKYVLTGSYAFILKSYVDQRLVNAAGQFEAGGRRDYYQSLGGTIGRPVPAKIFGTDGRLDLSLALSFALNKSNQNTYDATFARFIPDAYSYWSAGLGPGATYSWGDRKRPTWTSASLRFNRQFYLGRLVQDGSGAYESSRQTHDRWNFSLGYGYPIAPKLTMTFRANLMWATSNHKFQRAYAYDYRAANYLIGLSYEY